MRCRALVLLFAPCLVAQTSPPSRPCTTVQTTPEDPDRLQRLLRERGPDALVDDVLGRGREFWKRLKERLLKPDASTYFAEAVQDAATFPELSGTVVLQGGKDLLVSPSGGNAPEVAILLDEPVTEFIQPGSTILFRGVPVAFSSAPFKLSIRATKKEIRLLPSKNPPAIESSGGTTEFRDGH